VTDQLVGRQHGVFPSNEDIELAAAAMPFREGVRKFADPQRLRRGSEKVEQDFKSLPNIWRTAFANTSRRHMKKPLSGSATSALQMRRDKRLASPIFQERPRFQFSVPPPVTLRQPTTKSAVLLQEGQHPGQQAAIVLKIAVHNRDVDGAVARTPLMHAAADPS